MKDYLQTVTGPVAREDMGLTLPHEHLFNDLSSVVDAPCYPFSQQLVDKKVTAEIQWALKHDPYCCADPVYRPVSYNIKHMAKVAFWLHSVQFACPDQAVQQRSPLSSMIRTEEQVVFAAQADHP